MRATRKRKTIWHSEGKVAAGFVRNHVKQLDYHLAEGDEAAAEKCGKEIKKMAEALDAIWRESRK